MKIILKPIFLCSAILISSCKQLKEDACYDIDHLWDPENNICTDDCIRQGGIFEIANKRCEIPLSGVREINDKGLFTSVQTACSEIQNLLEHEFNIVDTSALKHANALQSRYPTVAPISYTSKYNFGQDGVCNYAAPKNEQIKIFIRKNSRIESKYSANEFDILKIERKQTGIKTPIIIWERD